MEETNNLVVGRYGCAIEPIVSAISTCSELTLTSWKYVAKGLNVPPRDIWKVEYKLATTTTSIKGSYSYTDAYRDIIRNWQARQDGEARFGNLIDVLLECKLQNAADTVCSALSEEIQAVRSVESMIETDRLCKKLCERQGWIPHFAHPSPEPLTPGIGSYRHLRSQILQNLNNVETNWVSGEPVVQSIQTGSAVNCLQYDEAKIVCGLSNGTIKIWNRLSLRCIKEIRIAKKAVECLQFNDEIIVAGDFARGVTVVDVVSGKILNRLRHHTDCVTTLRFSNNMLITGSFDTTIAIWNMNGAKDIQLRKVLNGHSSGVTGVDFDKKYIVSSSCDKTIRVWDTQSCQLVRTLVGHETRIWCMEYHDGKVVSGDENGTIRIWDVECGDCQRIPKGHESDIYHIVFDSRRIVSGGWNGELKIWDMRKCVQDSVTCATAESACVRALHRHTSGVWALQADDFQIISGSRDGTILIWDFDI